MKAKDVKLSKGMKVTLNGTEWEIKKAGRGSVILTAPGKFEQKVSPELVKLAIAR